MKAPKGLTATGRASWNRARRRLDELGHSPEPFRDALDRYARTVDLVAKLRRAAAEKDAPAKTVDQLLSAERAADRFAERLFLFPAEEPEAKRGRGRPPGAASAPDRKDEPEPVVPLRAV